MRETSGRLSGVGGLRLFYRVWEPDVVRSSIVLVHGAAEHVGRYEHVAAWLAERGFAVWAMDHRGHGQSEGHRMYIDRFEEYLADLNAFVSLATARHGKPVMLGHSMGGLIAYRYAIAYPDTMRGLVLSSPWFKNKAKVDPVRMALAPVMSALVPRLKIAAPINSALVTRNPDFHRRDQHDPFMARVVTPRWYMECARAAAACHTSLSFPADLPVLFLVAGTDLMVDPEAARSVFERVGHDRKAFRLYPEKYHEILNDPGYEEVLAEMLTWLRAQGLVTA